MLSETAPPRPLIARSYYSLLKGCKSPKQLARYAKRSSYTSLMLADHNSLYGLPSLVEACRGEGIKPLASSMLEDAKGFSLFALAQNKVGYARLCYLITCIRYDIEKKNRSFIDPYSVLPTQKEDFSLLTDLLENGWEGLILLVPSSQSLKILSDKCSLGIYCAIPYARPFRKARDHAKSLNLPICAFSRSVFFDGQDLMRYELLRAVDLRLLHRSVQSISAEAVKGKPSNLSREIIVPERGWYAHGYENFASFYSAIPEALTSLSSLETLCADAETFFSRPAEFPLYKDMTKSDAVNHLRSLCLQGALERYGTKECPSGQTHAVLHRLEYEIDIIARKGFAPYFLTVRDIVLECPRTAGRGSAASSIVSYLLKLTHVDPLAYNLFFERFLNEGRTDPPDIDIDFPWDERPKVLDTVLKKWKGRAAMVSDHCTFSYRSSLREAALALGKDDSELESYVTLMRIDNEKAIPEDVLYARDLLKGIPRNLGTHPGGVVITASPILNFSPLEPSAAGLPLLAFEKDGTEFAGLVKIDILGNRSLAVLRDSIEIIDKKMPEEKKLEWSNADSLTDKKTRNLIESGNTTGVFYIESPATRQLLKKMGTGDFEHIVVASSIIRPAANKLIGEYVQRLKTHSWKHLHKSAEDTLSETYGIMVYQEDVSRIAIACALFDPAKADSLRKCLTKKRSGGRIHEFYEEFKAGCTKNSVSAEDIETLWNMMLSFDGYSFCKAHSASYALVSYRLAYIKAYWPLVFFASVINNGGGYYTRQIYINEVKRSGFLIFPPSVQKSTLRYEIEKSSFGNREGLRTPLCQAALLSSDCITRILESRKRKGLFTSFVDFYNRVEPNARDIRPLVLSGALDGLSLHDASSLALKRPEFFWAHFQLSKETGLELFPELLVPPKVEEYSRSRILQDERDILKLVVSCELAPLFIERAEMLIKKYKLPHLERSKDLKELVGMRVSLCGVAASAKQARTKTGESMSFWSFEDSDGMYEAVIFPKAYTHFLPILETRYVFIVCGIVDSQDGAISITVEDLVPLDKKRSTV